MFGSSGNQPQSRPPVDVAVVIPAHNEETALATTLAGVMQQDFPGSLHVIVVANGCGDRTAEVARSFSQLAVGQGRRLTVIELRERGKPAALNAGDQEVHSAVRVYLDADVTLSPNAIAATVEALSGEGCELAAPSIAVGWNDNPVARSYGRVWASTPAVRRHVIGCGMYAVTAEGRTRWDRFPDIISDDKFVRSHFRVDEQRVVPTATLTMYLPTTVRELVRVRSRWCRGNRQLAQVLPQSVPAGERWRHVGAAWHVLTHRRLWRHAPAAALVYGVGELRGRRSAAQPARAWEVAHTSSIRCAPAPAVAHRLP